eukprot:6173260-Pleurochrysis_carterae.AAC.1
MPTNGIHSAVLGIHSAVLQALAPVSCHVQPTFKPNAATRSSLTGTRSRSEHLWRGALGTWRRTVHVPHSVFAPQTLSPAPVSKCISLIRSSACARVTASCCAAPLRRDDRVSSSAKD